MIKFLLVIVDILLIHAFLGDLVGLLMGVAIAIALNWVILYTHQELETPQECLKKAKR